jgi:hypothetical protein
MSKSAEGIVEKAYVFKGIVSPILEITFVDDSEQPIAELNLMITIQDGQTINAKTDNSGVFKFLKRKLREGEIKLLEDEEADLESQVKYVPDCMKLPVLDLCNKDEPNPKRGHGPLGNEYSKPSQMSYDNLKGDKYQLVKLLQTMLAVLGYPGDSSGADGMFGDETEAATKSFQQDYKDFEGKPLKEDGKVGPKTSDALNRALVGRWYPEYRTPIELTKDFLLVTTTKGELSKGMHLDFEEFKKANIALMPVEELCCIYVQLYDDSVTRVLGHTAYCLRGLFCGTVINGTTDEQGILRHEYLPDDSYELESGGGVEVVDTYYADAKENYEDVPTLLRMRGSVITATGQVTEIGQVMKKLPSSIVIAPDARVNDEARENSMATDAKMLERKYGYRYIPIKQPQSIEGIFSSVEKIVNNFKKETGVEEIKPFLTDFRIIGHGYPGAFKFSKIDPHGRLKHMYTIKDLRELSSGRLTNYLVRNALVYIDGCDVAAGNEGKQFLCEVGRVFFGHKAGRVRGNKCTVVPGGDEISVRDRKHADPIEIKWPEQCQGTYKEMMRFPSFNEY